MKKVIFCSLLVLIWISVGSAQNRPFGSRPDTPPPITQEERALFNQSRSLAEQGNTDQAASTLEQFLLKYPKSALLPDVYLEFAAIYTQKGELKRTVEVLRTFLQKFPKDTRIPAVRVQLSRTHLSLGELKEVMELWAEIPGQEEAKIEIFDNVARAYQERKEYLEALQVLARKRELVLDPAINESVRSTVVGIIKEKLSERELQSVIKQFGMAFPADEAIIHLIKTYDLKADYYREERELKRFLSLFPNHSFSVNARNLSGQIKDKMKANRYLIAIALHLSGKFAPFANNALNGAQLALEEFKEALPGASVGLIVKDLDENPGGLERSLEGWLEEFRPVAMVGPLMGKEVDRVVPVIERAGLPLITPGATGSRLSGLGNGVFRNAMTNRSQCHAIAEYGVAALGLTHFAILFPKENFGAEWAKCFSEEVKKLGGDIVHAEPYPLNETDFSPAIRRLKEADLKKDGIAEIQEEGKKKREISYSPGFQAIFLPGDAQKVGLLIPQLAFHNIEDVILLGTNGWNAPEFLKLAGAYAEGATFIDGFFQGSPDPMVRDFVGRYRAKFQQEPDLLAAQAFDATRLILTALEGGALTPQEIKEVISKTKNFPGASGLIYEVKDGELIKKPFLIQVNKGKFVHLEGPPKLNPSISSPLAGEAKEKETVIP